MTNAVPRGLIAPILTPFNADGTVAQDLYNALAHHLLGNGCVALAPFGTTGEALSVGIDERIAALDGLIADGVDPAQLIPGTGLTNLADTARLSIACLERGCAGIMVLPPFYYKSVPDDGLVAYFSGLVDAIGHSAPNIYLYHIPQVAGVGIPVPVVRALRERFPREIVGIKDSSGDWDNTSALLSIEGLIVYPGSELPILQALQRGAPGCISATGNLNAEAVSKIISLYDANDLAGAHEAFEAAKNFRMMMTEFGPIPAQKMMLAASTGDARWTNLRPPLRPLSNDKARELSERLRREPPSGLAAE
ncbi:MAG: dihydrodipicolinate synthase family protein [Hyphomicrobiales bacterium]|nr:dihydrodipicolinate synthase family protein [Hyphomicrobiales bacterium]